MKSPSNDEGALWRERAKQQRLAREEAEGLLEAKEAELDGARSSALAASKAKALFLANMSHELRTPMHGILGMGAVLLDTQLDQDQRRCVGVIERSALTLLDLIEDILDFSKIEAGRMMINPSCFLLRRALDSVITLQEPKARQKGLSIEYRVDDGVPDGVRGDAARLCKVLSCLIGNAIKFTHLGSIELTVDLVAASAAGVRVEFAVTDTGIGIAPKMLEQVFEPFTQADLAATRRFGGSGLGLTISRRLVHLMEGEMSVASTIGKGSTFRFSLPLGIASEQQVEDSRLAVPGELDALVLLVEDNEVNRCVATRMLQSIGAHVVEANDGREAVALFQVREFDIVLMDYHMPVMGGLEATREIRRLEQDALRGVPIIAMTANTAPGAREECFAAGMDDYLAKPFTKAALMKVLSRWAELSRPGKGTKRLDSA